MIRKHLSRIFFTAAFAALVLGGCNATPSGDDPGPNPFLDNGEQGKADTGYINLRGVETEVTVEADVEASTWRIYDAPADLAQYAVTYLRNKRQLYLEILAEDATADDRVEWLVDGQWLTRSELGGVDKSKLRHFRFKGVNAVLMNRNANRVHEGTVYNATVPIRPYKTMDEGGKKCANPDHHLGLSQSIYWYLWNPDRSGCNIDTQTMTLTVERVLPKNPESYPEYDRLLADNRLDVVVLFGKLDDGDVKDDQNWRRVKDLAKWLTEAGFEEAQDAPMGRRFIKHAGELTEVVDIYGPDLFHSVADFSRLDNWQKAVSEHEVVMYNGHSVLGSGMAFERVQYPERYQIFQIASCLSYEYYVRPILEGKGGWENVDVISNFTPTYFSEMLPLTSTILAKLIWGCEHDGKASWQDIMEAVSNRLYHYRFGVSGARDNCFSPEGNRCEEQPQPDPTQKKYESTDAKDIPDNNPDGVTVTLSVPDSMTIADLSVTLNITHTWVGDLEVVLSHDGRSHKLWAREGSSDDNILESFDLEDFDGQDASGDWTLHVVDHARRDVGTINSWSIEVTPKND
ncbi:MAG: proprotein convertase P-domain-containing protein [Deltaproteobacteria bacterium]|nr:proprotein convertase P-domain-containing protein [Deltaproteobacteria bacterium]